VRHGTLGGGTTTLLRKIVLSQTGQLAGMGKKEWRNTIAGKTSGKKRHKYPKRGGFDPEIKRGGVLCTFMRREGKGMVGRIRQCFKLGPGIGASPGCVSG